MKRFIPIIILSICMSCGSLSASELIKVSRVDARDIIQLYFSFDTVPAFTETVNERRINLIFKETEVHPDFEVFKGDSNIVKVLAQPEDGDYVVSLFFRYKPQYYTFTRSEGETVVFEVLLGNQYSQSYKELADRLKGVSVLDKNAVDNTNPYISSPYVKDWISFFSQYESPVTLDIPVQFSFLPFPIIDLLPPGMSGEQQTLSAEMLELAAQGQWSRLAGRVLEKLQLEFDTTQKKMLALTYGELLARADDFAGAFKQLYLLKETFPEELIGNFAEYLLLLIRAIHEDPYIADTQFKILEKKISASNPLTPSLHLSLIETALATSQHTRMNELLLRDDIAFPAGIAEMRKIRQADYWFSINRPIKAYVAYSLLHQSAQLLAQPYSMNGNCTTLYDQKKFRESAECYDQLASLSLTKKNSGLVRYRANMARLKFQSGSTLIDKFAQIENIFSDSEPAYRAALKKIDLILLQDRTQMRWALKNYTTVGGSSILRPIIEEALFKQALIHSMLGQHSESVALLQKLLREFRQGDIRLAAQSLLIELLPQEIQRLVAEKNYLEALTLAKQNKELFQKNWISSTYLVDIANAYSKIGINNEAQQLYLYLIEVSPADKKEQYYLPMIKAAYNYGNSTLVEEYAAQYNYRYPKGKFKDEVLFYQLQALISNERLADALRLLPSPLPEDVDMYRLAAVLFYRTEHYERSAEMFARLELSDTKFTEEEQIMYGESLLKTAHFEEAERLFRQVTRKNPFYDQSLYRLAELERRKGEEKNALSLFKKIVETGTSDLWKQYAQKELQIAEANARM